MQIGQFAVDALPLCPCAAHIIIQARNEDQRQQGRHDKNLPEPPSAAIAVPVHAACDLRPEFCARLITPARQRDGSLHLHPLQRLHRALRAAAHMISQRIHLRHRELAVSIGVQFSPPVIARHSHLPGISPAVACVQPCARDAGATSRCPAESSAPAQSLHTTSPPRRTAAGSLETQPITHSAPAAPHHGLPVPPAHPQAKDRWRQSSHSHRLPGEPWILILFGTSETCCAESETSMPGNWFRAESSEIHVTLSRKSPAPDLPPHADLASAS